MQTPIQTAIEKLKQQKERIEQASCVPYDKTVRIIQIQHDITILESLLPEERERLIGFAELSRFAINESIETLFNITYTTTNADPVTVDEQS